MNVHWMVLYKLYIFCSDMKFKMAATAGLSLTLDPMAEFLKFIGPRGQKIMRSAYNVSNAGPHVPQTFLNDVFTFITEVGNAGRIVNTGTSSVNSEFVTALNT